MEKSNRTFQIAVVVGLLLLVSVVVGYQSSVTGNAPRQGGGGQPQRSVPQAASCDADAVCEMQEASVTGSVKADTGVIRKGIFDYVAGGQGYFGDVLIRDKTISTAQGSGNQLRLSADSKSIIVADSQLNVHPPEGLHGVSIFLSPNTANSRGTAGLWVQTPQGSEGNGIEVNNWGTGRAVLIKSLSQPQLEIDSTDPNQPASIRFRTGPYTTDIGAIGGDIRISPQGVNNRVYIDGNVHVSRALTANAITALDSFELGTFQTPQGYPKAAMYIAQPNADLVVNSKATFNNDIALQDIYGTPNLNEIKIHKTVEVYGEVGVQDDVEADGVRVRSLAGQGRSFACFDDTGRLVRSDTPCR